MKKYEKILIIIMLLFMVVIFAAGAVTLGGFGNYTWLCSCENQ